MTMQPVPPGWYPESQGSATLRWWDGSQWTSYTQPVPQVPAPPQPATPAAPVAVPQSPAAASYPPPLPTPETPPEVPASRHRMFGGKRELEEEVARLTAIVDSMGVTEQQALQAEIGQLKTELPSLRSERAALGASVVPLRAEVAGLQGQAVEVARLRTEIGSLTAQRDALSAETDRLRQLENELPALRSEYDQLQRQLVETRETAILQEVGVYQYRHLLDDAPAYKAKLTGLQAQIKDAVKAGNAVVGSTTWTVNGSSRDGTRMVKEFSKLMLRAYNNEADNSIRSMKPYTLESAVARLTKAKDTISKLGQTMHITVTPRYHALRVTELELTADYLAKIAEEKDRDREERARLREEEIARREYEREQERLRKERAHYEEAAAQLRAQGNHEAADEADTKLAEIDDAIEGINRRAANVRAGHVYVISNLGSFGPEMVKIGMTRRLDPMERVRELGDASVPFRYDVHAMVFSDDAVSLETYLHHVLADCRVNLVNMRREFFRTHPSSVKEILLASNESIVTWVEQPEAIEYRQSETTRRQRP